jgi:hypothetical protein
MSKQLTQSLSQKKVVSTKLIMGMMVAAVSVLVGTSNIANAAPGNGHGGQANASAKANASSGYGGNINIDLGNIIGNNNVIVIVINYFAGH